MVVPVSFDGYDTFQNLKLTFLDENNARMQVNTVSHTSFPGCHIHELL